MSRTKEDIEEGIKAVKAVILNRTSDKEILAVIRAFTEEKNTIAPPAGHIQSLTNVKMICEATITFNDKTISRFVVVGGGFTEDLTLEWRDVVELGLGERIGEVTLGIADHSPAVYNIFSQVTVTLTFTDGSTESASLTPLVFRAPTIIEPSVVSEERLIGYNGMHKLGLKLDYRTHRLIRRSRRI